MVVGHIRSRIQNNEPPDMGVLREKYKTFGIGILFGVRRRFFNFADGICQREREREAKSTNANMAQRTLQL